MYASQFFFDKNHAWLTVIFIALYKQYNRDEELDSLSGISIVGGQIVVDGVSVTQRDALVKVFRVAVSQLSKYVAYACTHTINPHSCMHK